MHASVITLIAESLREPFFFSNHILRFVLLAVLILVPTPILELRASGF